MIANLFDRPLHAVPDRVTVLVNDLFDCRATCTCGHLGKRRWLKTVAKQDAFEHSIDSGHMPATPLVVR